ncbi:MAG: hypothetical protein QXH30_03430, partial [Candidatus Bilamarchaeaceae archaeon]
MGKWAKRIAIATAISIGVHLGAVGGLKGILPDKIRQPLVQVEQRPKMDFPPLTEKPIGAKAEEKKEAFGEKEKINELDLGGLRQEKSKFVEEMRIKLQSGNKIRLSDFFIRAEALDRNIEMAEKGEFGPKESEMRERYFEILKKANSAVIGAENEIAELHRFMHTKALAGYFWGSTSILDALGKGWYNCASSTELFSALLQDVLGKEKFKILVFDDHLANVVGGRRIDAVNPRWENTNVKFNGCGMEVPPEMFIAAYLHKNGIDLDEIPKRLSRFYDVQKSWPGCPNEEKNMNDMSGAQNSYSFPKPGAKSGLSVPSYFVPNPEYQASTEEVVKMARALFAAYQFAQENGEKMVVDDKQNPNKPVPQTSRNEGSVEMVLLKPLRLPKDADWGLVIESFKDYFSKNAMVPYWPERIKCNYTFSSIPPETIPDMIARMPEEESRKWEYYKRENICKRMKRAAEVGTISEIFGYGAFTFCVKDYPEVNKALKRRYLEERNGDMLRYVLGDVPFPENFDFFLSEFRNAPNAEIRRRAAGAMVFSDKEKACRILMALPESEKLDLAQQLVWGCNDNEIGWRVLELSNSYKIGELSALARLDGRNLTKEQCEFIEDMAMGAQIDAKIEIGRVLFECGNREAGFRVAREVVKESVDNGTADLMSYRYPKEMNPIFLPLSGKDGNLALEICKMMLCNGGVAEHRNEIVDALRRIIRNMKTKSAKRVEAAFLLLKMGVEPA